MLDDNDDFLFIHTAPEKSLVVQMSVLTNALVNIFSVIALQWSPWWKAKVTFQSINGTVHQIINFRLNLIFWIVMGSGEAHFGRRGLKNA